MTQANVSATLVVIALLACRAQAPQPSLSSAEIDSSAAVVLATAALKRALPMPDSLYRVLEFTRDADGVMVYLSPALPAGVVGAGGGGRVRVWKNGKTMVIELGQ